MICERCGTRNSNRATVCSGCGNPLENLYGNGYDGVDMPMKWYKFLTYFYWWFCAATSLTQAFGGKGQKILELASYYEPAIKSFNIFTSIILAVMYCYTGFCLIKFKRIAPAMVIATAVVGTISGLILVIWIPTVIDFTAFYGVDNPMAIYTRTIVGVEIWNVVYIILNVIYFRKRQHLFTN